MISAEEIIKLIEQGVTLKEISKLVGESYYKLREQGNTMEQAKRIIIDLMYELLIHGLTQKEIAKIININEETVKKRLRIICEEKGQDYIEINRRNRTRKKNELKEQKQAETRHAIKRSLSDKQKRELEEKRKEWERYLKEEYQSIDTKTGIDFSGKDER